MPHKIGTGAIMGIASEDGLPAQKRVTLMDRTDLRVISKVTSDEYGAYAFNGLNTETNDYIVFAVDDDDPKKAAIIYDYVKPIPVHQGAAFFANWFILSLAKESIVSIIGSSTTSSDLPADMPFGVGTSGARWLGNSVTANNLALSPAAYNIGTLSLKEACVVRQGIYQKGLPDAKDVYSFSCEWLLSLPSVLSTAAVYLCRTALPPDYDYAAASNPNGYNSCPLSIKYYRGSNKIQVLKNSGLVSSVKQDSNPDTDLIVAIDYILPLELQEGDLHISASIEYGSHCNLYINGVQVATTSLTGTPLNTGVSNYSSHTNMMAVVGGDFVRSTRASNNNYATFDFSMVAFYTELMSEVEALSHYQALFIETLPKATGYVKEVFADYPSFFYRFDDDVDSFVAKDRLRPNAATDSNILNEFEPDLNTRRVGGGLVLGGSGTVLNGGYFYQPRAIRVPQSSYQLSFEVILEPKLGIVNGQEILLQVDGSASEFFRVRLAPVASGVNYNLLVYWIEASTATSVMFNYEIRSDEMHHYVVTLDKISLQIKLYVNGLLVEIAPVSALPIKQQQQNTEDLAKMYIGRSTSSNTDERYSRPYYGYIAELSVYSTALSAERVKAHYDAMQVI